MFPEYAVLKQFALMCNPQAELLKIVGEKHVLYDFVGTLTMRCSYLLVNKEYAKEILSEASEQKTSGNTKLIPSCMNLLTVRCFPELLFSFCAAYWPHCFVNELVFCSCICYKSLEQPLVLLVCLRLYNCFFQKVSWMFEILRSIHLL